MGKKVGAQYLGNGNCLFRVWSPFAEKVEVVLKDREEPVAMVKDERGYWETVIGNRVPGNRYKFRLDEEDEFPDPASRSQPEGVHSWSEIIDATAFSWKDSDYKGRELKDMIIYELHVGVFTPEGTFTAIVDYLDHLEELGVNTLELMPIAQFPGSRNWGYDGVYPFAAQESYGGVEGLKILIDACHRRGFSVILDVVYNHLGPEGNYLSQFGPYFTDKYHTPWGSALNFDDEHSDHVRNFFFQSALMWLEEFHFDGLRLDAIHEIIDRGARHFLKELSEQVDLLEQKTGRRYMLIAESDLNDTRVISDYDSGGYGLEGQWVDDFHHAVHTLLTGENSGYYKDYGKMEYLAKSFKQAFIYDGMYSKFRKRTVGNSPEGFSPKKFVTCIQNHDQVGNRLLGERLSELVSFEKQKLAAGILITAPFVPMFFMGEEFGEKAPFRYFVSHGDQDLVKAVQEGRKREFEYFNHREAEFPDPQAEKSFKESKLHWNFKSDSRKKTLFNTYKELLRLRKQGAFQAFAKDGVKVTFNEGKMLLEVTTDEGLFGIFNFGSETFRKETQPGKEVKLVFASADEKWGGEKAGVSLLSKAIEVPKESFIIYKI